MSLMYITLKGGRKGDVMSGRFHIYIIKRSSNGPQIESRSLCPECASRPMWRVQELYERNGGVICSGCGVEPAQYEREHINVVPTITNPLHV